MFIGIRFLILYRFDTLHTSNDKSFLNKVNLASNWEFDMKDMQKTSYFIEIEIYKDKCQDILCLSYEIYINKILAIFFMSGY